CAFGGVKEKTIFRPVIKRAKEWNALDVIPVKMRNKDVSCNRAAVEFVSELLTEATKSCAAVENKNLLAGAHLHARGIPSVAKIFRLGSRHRTAHAPKSDSHSSCRSLVHLQPGDEIRQFMGWFTLCSLVESSLWFLCDLCDALATFAVKSFEPQRPGKKCREDRKEG